MPLDPAKHYDVYSSTTSGDPPIPSESTLTELDPAGTVAKLPLAERCWASSGAWWPACAASSGAEDPPRLRHLAPR